MSVLHSKFPLEYGLAEAPLLTYDSFVRTFPALT